MVIRKRIWFGGGTESELCVLYRVLDTMESAVQKSAMGSTESKRKKVCIDTMGQRHGLHRVINQKKLWTPWTQQFSAALWSIQSHTVDSTESELKNVMTVIDPIESELKELVDTRESTLQHSSRDFTASELK